MYKIIYLQNLVTYDTLNNMERNGNTGGNNSSFEDIMREGGVSDEFTPPSLDIPGSCASCPMLNSEVERWKELVDKVRAAREMVLESEEGLFIDIARRALSGSMNALDEAAEETQTKIYKMAEGCLGAILLSSESDRTGKTVRGAVCDSPTRDPKSGETTSNEPATVIREAPQKTEEHGESDDHSDEQDS